LKSVFERAIELLQENKTVKVFAPTGIWAIDGEKDQWIEALSNAKNVDRTFIAGLAPSPKYEEIVSRRLNLMVEGGVNVYTIEPQDCFRLGFMVFDKIALVGFTGTNEKELRYFETDEPEITRVLGWVLDDVIRHREQKDTKKVAEN